MDVGVIQDRLGPAVVWAAGLVSESFGKRLLNLINPMHETLGCCMIGVYLEGQGT